MWTGVFGFDWAFKKMKKFDLYSGRNIPEHELRPKKDRKNWLGMRLLAIQVEGKKWLKSSSCPYLEKGNSFLFWSLPEASATANLNW